MIAELNGDFLQWLRGFYYVAKTGSVRAAAELMCRNPSTISYQLKSLENELGTVLFDRYKKTLRITPEGKKLLGWTISTFETLQSMRSAVSNARGELSGEIKMAATLPIACLAAGEISAFTRKHPRVNLIVERELSANIRKLVADSEVDFGLMALLSRPETDNFEIILKSRPLLIMHRENPWNVPPIPDMNDLRELPYVAFASKDGPDELGCFIKNSGMGDFIQKNSVLQCNNYHLMMRFVWQKLGATIMDEVCFQGTNFGAEWNALETRALDHLLPNRLYGILTRAHKHISPQARALMDDLRACFRKLSFQDSEEIWSEIRQTKHA